MSKRKSNSDDTDALLALTQDLIKDRLQNDKIHFYGHSEQKRDVSDLFERTISFGESNIALLIGSRGSGKTTVSTEK